MLANQLAELDGHKHPAAFYSGAASLLRRFILAATTFDRTGWMPIPQKFLSPNNARIVQYKRWLVEHGLIEWNRYYTYEEGKKGKCQEYKINWQNIGFHPDMVGRTYWKADDDLKDFTLDDAVFDWIANDLDREFVLNRITVVEGVSTNIKLDWGNGKQYMYGNQGIQHAITNGQIIFSYKDKYFAVQDTEAFDTWVDKKVIELKWHYTMMAKDAKKPKKYWSFDKSPNGREYTSITNLPKKLRKFLRIEGEEIGNIDIRNSQPVILANLVRREGLKEDYYVSNSGITNFVNVSGKGQLYEMMMEKLGIEDRNKCKEAIFKVMYDKPRRTNHSKILDETFPGVVGFCNAYKRKHGYEQLAIAMQRFEGQIMKESLASIRERGYRCTGIHDSVLCKKSDVEPVKALFSEVLSKYLLKFTLAIETYDSERISS